MAPSNPPLFGRFPDWLFSFPPYPFHPPNNRLFGGFETICIVWVGGKRESGERKMSRKSLRNTTVRRGTQRGTYSRPKRPQIHLLSGVSPVLRFPPPPPPSDPYRTFRRFRNTPYWLGGRKGGGRKMGRKPQRTPRNTNSRPFRSQIHFYWPFFLFCSSRFPPPSFRPTNTRRFGGFETFRTGWVARKGGDPSGKWE